MTTNNPFIRQVELIVGPLPEHKGGGNEQQALRIFSDGSQGGLRVKFNIHKHKITTATPTTIEIYNLTRERRNSFQRGQQLRLKVGWANTDIVQVFQGTLLAVVHDRQGADIVTTLISLSGYGAIVRGVASVAFAGGSSLKEAVVQLARNFPGISVDLLLIQIPDVPLGIQGFSFAGQASEALDKLSRVHGFSWWIHNGFFYALDDKQGFLQRVLISAKNGFLLRAEPMLASPEQVQSGVSISSLLNPYIEPGVRVVLESEINKNLNGEYVVHTLSHTGDTHGEDWRTSIESWIIVGDI